MLLAGWLSVGCASAGGTSDPCGGVTQRFTRQPVLQNRADVVESLQRESGALLDDFGRTFGKFRLAPDVCARIGTDGLVGEARIVRASGIDAMDAAALRVVRAMRYDPALEGERPVAVWRRIPISFQVR